MVTSRVCGSRGLVKSRVSDAESRSQSSVRSLGPLRRESAEDREDRERLKTSLVEGGGEVVVPRYTSETERSEEEKTEASTEKRISREDECAGFVH